MGKFISVDLRQGILRMTLSGTSWSEQQRDILEWARARRYV